MANVDIKENEENVEVCQHILELDMEKLGLNFITFLVCNS